MGTLFKWLLVLLIAVLLLSEVKLNTSLYRYEDNQIEITFPSWRAEDPWYYLKWNPAEGEVIHRRGPES
ncbi:hypothetical protein [Zobellella iuensis]|uniref:Uncharacterized protein n=1 Tax=Zobellella iuensis TaxID=2803811 RepID=A0ABS1QQ68_9GAMM|nr:hypothetical protein [Zobellella iuensis]MBL1376652.1 hypothetical protein [Zobellella iuensis]